MIQDPVKHLRLNFCENSEQLTTGIFAKIFIHDT